jgi:hypothetical protein
VKKRNLKKGKKALDSQDIVWYSKQVAQDVPKRGARPNIKKRAPGKKELTKGTQTAYT